MDFVAHIKYILNILKALQKYLVSYFRQSYYRINVKLLGIYSFKLMQKTVN